MMQIFHSLGEVPADFGPSVVTVGNFDGVHCGHKAVLAQVLTRAREFQAKAVVVTFSPHPAQVIRPGSAPRLLTPDAIKLELLATCGLDATIVLPFNEELRRTTAHDFAQQVLCGTLRAIEVQEGDNFQFGYRGEGSVIGLQHLGVELGFRTAISAPLLFAGQPISSSRVRACVLQGRMAETRHLLGRSFSIRGTPASGRGFGSRYTVPTINLAPYAGVLPANGVYVTNITVAGECFNSVTNIGNRPTFGADSFAVESHILNFHPLELRENTQVDLTFHLRLRQEKTFDTPELLREQIGRDVRRAQRWFELRERFESRRHL